MSKIKLDKINYDKDDFVIAVDTPKNTDDKVTKEELEQNRLKSAVEEILEKAQQKAQQKAEEIIKSAEDEKQKIMSEAEDILNNAKKEAENIIKETNENSKEELDKQKVEAANTGYQEGYSDGEKKVYEELEEKIGFFNTFCNQQYEIKNKILKSASNDILDVILNISKKILLKEVDGEIIKNIIEKTVTLLEKKENINIILSEKYARLLYEFQKKSLTKDIDFNFEDFKQFENFQILYNPKLQDDTIIIENLKERFDASINSQLDIITRDIFENTSGGKIEDIEEYKEDEA